jgi:hypothetical protein
MRVHNWLMEPVDGRRVAAAFVWGLVLVIAVF